MFATITILALVFAQQKAAPAQIRTPTKPVTVEQSKFQGRVETVKRDSLKRFDKPVTKAPEHRPPPRPGGFWRWHQRIGWIWLPALSAPAQEVLVENFVLPAEVVVYQQPATITVVCPHCGREIQIIPK